MDCVCKSCRAVFEFNEMTYDESGRCCPQCGESSDQIVDAEYFHEQDDLS